MFKDELVPHQAGIHVPAPAGLLVAAVPVIT
jgi:hypothetical protein